MDRIARIKTASPVPYKLIQIEPDTHDTKTFRFELPADTTLDMLPGDFLYVHATLNGKTVKRAYTPSSLPGVTGHFDLTVKRYETGLVSRYLHEQRIGDTVLMSGPNAGGHWVDGMAKQVGFVAGGTGITPMPVLQSLSQARNKWGDHAASTATIDRNRAANTHARGSRLTVSGMACAAMPAL